jgi:hypothetical protein
MVTSLTRDGNFISVYPRAVPRRRGGTGQRGGAWNVTNKARKFLEAGLTAAVWLVGLVKAAIDPSCGGVDPIVLYSRAPARGRKLLPPNAV